MDTDLLVNRLAMREDWRHVWDWVRAGLGRRVEVGAGRWRLLLILLLPILIVVANPLITPVAAPTVRPEAPATAEPVSAQPTMLVVEPTAVLPPSPTVVQPSPTPLPTATPVAALAPTAPPPPPTATAPPTPEPVVQTGLPQRLIIPRLRIDTVVEHVGLTADGAMDVPKRFDTVGWYELGARPGERGNAVLAGHLDSKTGPAIFWDLRDLGTGDDVIVVSDDGVERRFEVVEAASYPFDQAPLEQIFGAADHIGLNLITCNGAFDRRNQNYDQRLVVYTRLKP